MLRSLDIRNYRNLRHLTIEKLGRVNLLVGKNNTGKTSVLEAVAILINQAKPNYLIQLLEERGETYNLRRIDKGEKSNALKAFSALFHNREPAFLENDSILIGELGHHQATSIEEGIDINIRFVKFNEILSRQAEDKPYILQRIYLDEDSNEVNYQVGLEIKSYSFTRVIPLDAIDEGKVGLGLNGKVDAKGLPINYQFIRTKNIDRNINGSLWDQIALKEEENEVINALKIIDSDVDRVAFLNDNYRDRIAVVRLKKLKDVIPLRSMGDGINRIFTIILAMVNCEDNYLLIDEFENGLHYSVQEKLWEIIFYLAERLNIQVFATTHSNDTIKAFGEVANSKPTYSDAQLIQLRIVKDEISAVLFSTQDVEIATETTYLDLR